MALAVPIESLREWLRGYVLLHVKFKVFYRFRFQSRFPFHDHGGKKALDVSIAHFCPYSEEADEREHQAAYQSMLLVRSCDLLNESVGVFLRMSS